MWESKIKPKCGDCNDDDNVNCSFTIQLDHLQAARRVSTIKEM